MSDHITAADIEAAGVNIDTIAEYLAKIIQQIRNNDNTTKALQTEIKKLEQCNKELDAVQGLDKKNSQKIITYYNCYKQIQQVSLLLRQALSRFMNVSTYDSISYAIYYNDQRYALDSLNPDFLRINSRGDLQLQVGKAVDAIKDDIQSEFQASVNAAFNQHYAVYLNAITGTYKGIIGRKGALNKGHIAEAFESHTVEHHPGAYSILNGLANSEAVLSVADKAVIDYVVTSDVVGYWAEHEGITEAWLHIREALGTQRGTVAGDVLNRQVKQTNKNARNLRLATLKTLKDGIALYSMVLGDGQNNPPIQEVAIKLAQYIAEPMRQTSAKIIDGLTNEDGKEVATLLAEINKTIEGKHLYQIG